MKLTKADREAFVNAVMNDVPIVDYDEMAQKLVREHIVSLMPAKIRAVYEDKKVVTYLDTQYVHMPGCLDSFRMPGVYDFKVVGELREKCEALAALKNTQYESRYHLQGQIAGVIQSCSTLKQAMERLPEFIEYLPADRDGTGMANLPAISNVVAELVQAGWPKDKPKPKKAAKK